VFGATIENVTFHPQRRVDLNIGVGYTADIDHTRSVLESAVGQVDQILDNPAPAIILSELGASSVNWIVQVWVNSSDFGTVKQGLLRAIKNSLDAAGIEIPFPQMDVHLRQTNGQANG